MIRPPLFLPLLLLPLALSAQIGILPHDSITDPITRHRIEVAGWADYNSNGLYNELPWRIYQGGYLSRDVRERSRGLLRSRNSAGYDVGMRLTWIGGDSLFGRPRLRPVASIAYRNTLGISFARDVYELAFFGNAHYEDRVAELHPSAHTQMTWQTAGFGIQDAVHRSYIRLDLVRGRSFNASDIRLAQLYTAPDGTSLQLTNSAEYWRTDTAGRGEEHTNGMGLSISGRLNAHRQVFGQPAEIAIMVEDAGFIAWNPNSLRMRPRESLVYEGVEVEDILDLGGVVIGEEQLLDTFGLRFERGAYRTMLPVRAALSMELSMDEHWKVRAQVDHRYLPGFMPQVMVSASRRFGQRVLVGTSTAYGGFGVFRFGVASRVRIGRAIIAELGSTHMPGLFMGQTRGAGAYVTLAAGF